MKRKKVVLAVIALIIMLAAAGGLIVYTNISRQKALQENYDKAVQALDSELQAINDNSVDMAVDLSSLTLMLADAPGYNPDYDAIIGRCQVVSKAISSSNNELDRLKPQLGDDEKYKAYQSSSSDFRSTIGDLTTLYTALKDTRTTLTELSQYSGNYLGIDAASLDRAYELATQIADKYASLDVEGDFKNLSDNYSKSYQLLAEYIASAKEGIDDQAKMEESVEYYGSALSNVAAINDNFESKMDNYTKSITSLNDNIKGQL